MSLDPSLPKELLHLLEKRQTAGRRKQDSAKSPASPVDAKLPAGIDRRKQSRRKSKTTKTRKTA